MVLQPNALPPLIRTIWADPAEVVSSWRSAVIPAEYLPLGLTSANRAMVAAYTVVGAMTAAQIRPVKIQAPVDIRGRRMTAPRCSGMVAHIRPPRGRRRQRSAEVVPFRPQPAQVAG